MAELLDLLEKTSRTFALSIPVLPEPTRKEVTLAYLPKVDRHARLPRKLARCTESTITIGKGRATNARMRA